jgi:hypothetical protein
MSIREEQCNKVCRTLDDVLANRPTERDSLIIAVRKAFESLEQLGNSEPLPSAQPERNRGKWIDYTEDGYVECPFCHNATNCDGNKDELHFCFSCGADMRGEQDG